MLPSKALPSPGAFAGPCIRVRAGGERGGSPKPRATGTMAALLQPCPMGPPPLRSSLGTHTGRGTGGDPAGLTGSAPSGPAVGVPEPVLGPWLGPPGAAPEPGGTCSAPAPWPGAGLQEPVKVLFSFSGRSERVWRLQFYPLGIRDQQSCLKLKALFNSHWDQSMQRRRIFKPANHI